MYALMYGVIVGHLPYCCSPLTISGATLRVVLDFLNVFLEENLSVGQCAGGSVHCYVH